MPALPFGANWFDVVWAIALVFGLWDGLRTGALGEMIRFGSWVLMIWLAVKYYVQAGDWFRAQSRVAEEPARLIAFVAIIIGVYIVSFFIRRLVHHLMQKSRSAAFLENFGGMVLGVMRMAIVMAVLTIWLSLVRSPFLHKHISTNSIFGSAVVKMIPSVEEVARKKYPETIPLFRDIDRPFDIGSDDLATNTTKKAR